LVHTPIGYTAILARTDSVTATLLAQQEIRRGANQGRGQMSLKDAKVVIVGGSSGLGLATAEAALAKGAQVTVTGRSPERLDAVRTQLGDGLRTESVDALDEAATQAFFSAQERIDHLFVTKGTYVADHHLAPPVAELRGPVDTRLVAVLNATKYALPKMSERGSITLMSGTAAVRPIPGTSMSSASCAAIEGLARGFAVDFAPIRVNALRAGFFDTPFLSEALGDQREAVVADLESRLLVGRIGRPAEAAAAVIFLMETGYVTGSCLTIDGGGSLV
jgi:NAD(P)-dependent dehydrogenase (short-subunit alcohol dehydrogenase family)